MLAEYDPAVMTRLGLPDPNNNGSNGGDKPPRSGDKYSLRPRSLRRRSPPTAATCEEDPPPKSNPCSKSRSSGGGKARQKPAPLSKYRRKTANARERIRMKEINQAFETLRRAVPHVAVAQHTNEKLTKITTLRLAMKYIAALSAQLMGGETSSASSHHRYPHQQDLLSDCSELDCFLLESDGESSSLPLNSSDLSEHSLTPPTDFTGMMDFTITDFAPLSPDFGEHLSHFDPFLAATGFS